MLRAPGFLCLGRGPVTTRIRGLQSHSQHSLLPSWAGYARADWICWSRNLKVLFVFHLLVQITHKRAPTDDGRSHQSLLLSGQSNSKQLQVPLLQIKLPSSMKQSVLHNVGGDPAEVA